MKLWSFVKLILCGSIIFTVIIFLLHNIDFSRESPELVLESSDFRPFGFFILILYYLEHTIVAVLPTFFVWHAFRLLKIILPSVIVIIIFNLIEYYTVYKFDPDFTCSWRALALYGVNFTLSLYLFFFKTRWNFQT